MRIACVMPIAGLLLACEPSTSTQTPEDPGAVAAKPIDDGQTTKPIDDGGDAVGDEGADDGAEGADDGAEGADEAEGDDGGAPAVASNDLTADPEPTHEPDEGTDDPEPKPKVASFELPRTLHKGTNDKCGKDPGVGESLKPFSLPSPEGKTITAGTYRGRVLVVNFWGTWCKPCLKELPEFAQLYRRYRKYGMTLLAIATDEEAEGVSEVVDKKKLAAKIAIAGEAYAGKYGSPKFPFTFIVDYKGVIRAAYRGYKPECLGQLEADIREQLEVRAEAKARRKKK